MEKLSKKYHPKEVEAKIYAFWQKSGFFEPKIDDSKKPFTMVIPPPNVTGSLHMGHALNGTIQDILVRYHRMNQIPTLWIPGTDHAGIATQNKVEQKLADKGKTRFDLGRENFEKETWKWKEKYQKRIINQLKSLGCSCDWSRERFTLDENYSKEVNKAFIHYYKKGWIYQGTRVVNWCPRCQTSISDLEIKHLPQKAKLYYFKYDKNFPITIATTRPETKLGDTAVAVHPNDKRYSKYIGQEFDINFAGQKRKIKIIRSTEIDPKFGTGALGVTPAHSIIDEKIAKENNLDAIKIIDENGQMTDRAGIKLKNLKVSRARKKIIKWLEKKKLLEKTEIIENNLATCDRCRTTIEPLPSKQWFLKMRELAKPAIKVVKEGKIKFRPERWKKVYLNWLENIEDWCISRQLWWGHRLPVWYHQTGKNPKSKIRNPKNKTKIYIGENPPADYKQVEDVLDTWFSSALWPFAVFEKPEDLDYFYPTSTLSTARDIIFLWVARMIFSSLELKGEIPFGQVLIHPTVLTSEGQRMSKSLGTGIDPMELIDEYGADAVRFGIAWHLTGLQDLRFSEDTILAARNFTNKIWNSARFVIMNTENSKSKIQMSNVHDLDRDPIEKIQNPNRLTKSDEKIVNQLNQLIISINSNIKKYNFGRAAQDLYHFYWNEFCDIYLEESKKQLQDPKLKENTQNLLLYALAQSLKLLHPFMPFITEEIWQKLEYKKALIVTEWPEYKMSKSKAQSPNEIQ